MRSVVVVEIGFWNPSQALAGLCGTTHPRAADGKRCHEPAACLTLIVNQKGEGHESCLQNKSNRLSETKTGRQ